MKLQNQNNKFESVKDDVLKYISVLYTGIIENIIPRYEQDFSSKK